MQVRFEAAQRDGGGVGVVESVKRRATLEVPQQHAAVQGSGGHERRRGRHSEALHIVGVAVEYRPGLRVGFVGVCGPDFDRGVAGARQQHLSGGV